MPADQGGAATPPPPSGDTLLVPYFKDCQLVRTCGFLLHMPTRSIVTAIAYLHRYHFQKDDPVATARGDGVDSNIVSGQARLCCLLPR